jgi:hypothetical protein
MKRTIAIAPVRKSIRVGAGQRMLLTSSRRESAGGGHARRRSASRLGARSLRLAPLLERSSTTASVPEQRL